MRLRIITTLAGLLLLQACATRPAYKRPAVSTPPVFRGTAETGSTSLGELKWFDVFKDEQLQDLIRTAHTRNYDVRDAVARIEAANANLGIRRSELYPTAGFSGDATTLRFSRGGNFPVPEGFSQRRTFGTVTLNMLSFEADVWGRLRSATEAARAELLAAEENRNAIVMTLVSDVATAYFNLLELDAELALSKQTLLTREESLRLIKIRNQRGLATVLDVREGEQLVHTAVVAIPTIEQQIEQTENYISMLLGQRPGSIPRGSSLDAQAMPVEVPTGLPSTLLERRPDIRAAERNLEAAHATISVARAAYFPRISLTGFLGSQSNELTSLFTGPTGVWQFVPQVSQPIFTGGRLRSNVEFAQAQQQRALVQYERVIQSAFREVSDALVAYRKARQIRAEQQLLVATLQDRARLSYMRYRRGVDPLLNALDADRDLYDAQLRLTQSKRNELQAVVQLYRALGGGWQQ
ncbi:MAG TPA: efflux transporter outer membrane subunit [Bryobacteraceae bacterium]|jgi:multidrug efflux system outer membrane protein|nr:efflux transporter outer membrane subunit [Bryobacteraceae bacterium]